MMSTLIQKNDGTLIIVPCGKKKIWDKFPSEGGIYAKDAYISSYFKLCRKYAETFSDKWVILSAKYGFIQPDFVIPENYDVSFKNSRSESISIQKLKKQTRDLEFENYKSVIVLGGRKYVEVVQNVLEDIGGKIKTPLDSLMIGERQAKLKESIVKGISL